MSQVWIAALALCAASIAGSCLGFVVHNLPRMWNDTILGYCAGLMLAAATVGLIVPAFDSCGEGYWWVVAIGVLLGAWFLNVLDLVTPHLHHITGLDPEQHTHNKSLNSVLLFVLAIALHKLPEGMAAGISLNSAEGDTSWLVSFGITVQNIPEGMVVVTPLLLAGVARRRTFIIAITIGLLEVIGVWIGYALGAASKTFIPVMLGFAGGAMLYVTSDEVIPETHSGGYQKQATYALLLGFITLILMEKVEF